MLEKQRTSMQRDQRVLRHSMWGAFCGWFSTYIVYLVFVTVKWLSDVLSSETPYWPSIHDWLLIYVVGVGAGSFVTTLAGWMFVGLPIAAVITDRQARSFKFMITIHILATGLPVTALCLLSHLLSPSARSFGISFSVFLGVLFNPLTVWAAAIGVIGGAAFCVRERRC